MLFRSQFYRTMLPKLSEVCFPLYRLTSDKVKFEWTDELEDAFQKSKKMLQEEMMNTAFDFNLPATLFTDASMQAISGVLMQQDKMVTCLSKTLSNAQRKWATIERELFAISWTCKKMRQFLLGKRFTIITDHKPLLGLFGKLDSIENQRMIAMVLSLSEYDFELKYKIGRAHV